jgi:hypothetical protein
MTVSLSSWRYLFVVMVILIVADLAPAQTITIPTTEQLRELYDVGQYHLCLQEISKLLFLKGEIATHVDRPKLLLLRGDCLVKLKDSRTAMKAFKDAEAAATLDPATWLLARAGTVILQNCRGLTYMPPAVDPIDVTTDNGWKQAAAAIFNATWQSSQSSLAAAQSAQDMSAIYPVVPTITNLVALNRVTGADPSQLIPTVRSIGQRAREVIRQFLAQQDQITSSVQQNANVVLNVTLPYSWWNQTWSPAVRQGLSTPDRDNLNQVIDSANQAYNLAMQGKKTAALVGGLEGKWQELADLAIQTRDRAQGVLDAE